MANTNRQFVLQARPKGMLAPGDLQLKEAPLPELKEGQALARVKYLSIDPTMRVWMAADSYMPAVAIGEVMRSGGFAEIIETRHPDYKKGDRVTGLTGLQEYMVIDASAKHLLQKVPKIPFVSDTVFLGVLGMNGLTAYFGMEIGTPKKGETLVVSAAAGATGSIAGQIGKIHGCRVVVCGFISTYTQGDFPQINLATVIVKRLRVQGFIIFDYASRFMEAATQLGQWKMFGKIKDRETIVEGLEKAPDAINMLFTGGNTGKLIVKV